MKGRFMKISAWNELLLYVECDHSRIASGSAELLLNAEKLIVLCNTL